MAAAATAVAVRAEAAEAAVAGRATGMEEAEAQLPPALAEEQHGNHHQYR